MNYLKTSRKWIIASLALLAFASHTIFAQPSATSISFQGALNGLTGQALPRGNYNLTFRFWDGPVPAARR